MPDGRIGGGDRHRRFQKCFDVVADTRKFLAQKIPRRSAFRIEIDREDSPSASRGEKRQHHGGRRFPDAAFAEPDGEADRDRRQCACERVIAQRHYHRRSRRAKAVQCICKWQRAFCFLQDHLDDNGREKKYLAVQVTNYHTTTSGRCGEEAERSQVARESRRETVAGRKTSFLMEGSQSVPE